MDKVREALEHGALRNHDYLPSSCEGCKNIEAALATPPARVLVEEVIGYRQICDQQRLVERLNEVIGQMNEGYTVKIRVTEEPGEGT